MISQPRQRTRGGLSAIKVVPARTFHFTGLTRVGQLRDVSMFRLGKADQLRSLGLPVKVHNIHSNVIPQNESSY